MTARSQAAAPATADDRRVLSYEHAHRAALRRFVSTGRLPMAPLARELAVSRATLYRVVGSRDQLLGDVLWELARRTLDEVVAEVDATPLTGVERLLEISHRFRERIAGFGPLQTLLRREPEDAFRVLFTAAGGVHERTVAAWAGLLREALDAGELDELPFGVDETAYLMVRIGESTLYGEMLAGVVPDRTLTDRLRRVILSGA